MKGGQDKNLDTLALTPSDLDTVEMHITEIKSTRNINTDFLLQLIGVWRNKETNILLN